MHGGVGHVVAGKPLDPALREENPDGVAARLREPRPAHRDRAQLRHPGGRGHQRLPDRPARRRSPPSARWRSPPARATRWSASHFADGGAGPRTWRAPSGRRRSEGAPDFRFLTADDATLGERIEAIATRVYGADGVDISPRGGQAARTSSSASATARCPSAWPRPHCRSATIQQLKGRPTGFRVPDPRRAPVRRRRLRDRLLRRHAHDARPSLAPVRRGRRHRRDGEIVGLF